MARVYHKPKPSIKRSDTPPPAGIKRNKIMEKQGFWIRIDQDRKSKHIVVLSEDLDSALEKAQKKYPEANVFFRYRILEVLT